MKPAILLLTILVVGGAIVWLIDRLVNHLFQFLLVNHRFK